MMFRNGFSAIPIWKHQLQENSEFYLVLELGDVLQFFLCLRFLFLPLVFLLPFVLELGLWQIACSAWTSMSIFYDCGSERTGVHMKP